MADFELAPEVLKPLYLELLRQLRGDDAGAAKSMLLSLHPVDAARLTALLPETERNLLFRLLSGDQAADIVERMNESEQLDVVGTLQPETASGIIGQMDSDEAADVLGDLPKSKSDAILAAMPAHRADAARRLIAYPENSAGGMMATEYIALKETLSVQNALRLLRRHYAGLSAKQGAYVYTIDRKNRLTGVLQLRDLVTRPPQELLADIKLGRVASLDVNLSKPEVAHAFRRHRYLALPVVDHEGVLLGVITSDDVMDLMHETAAQEMMKLQGVSTDDSRSLPVSGMVRRRIGWLSLNIILNLLAASVIAVYSDTLKAVIALAIFLPILSDMSIVSGMQAVAVSIRDMTLGRTAPHKFREVLWKEVRLGFINGLILGAEIGLVAFLWKGTAVLGAVVALSLWLNTILAVALGGTLPLLIKRLNWDPAVASGPFLTTLTDMLGFLIMLSLATKLLPYLV